MKRDDELTTIYHDDKYAQLDDELCNEIENDDDARFEYDERLHLLMCELIARIDSRKHKRDASNDALLTIRNALHAFVGSIINK